MSKKILALLMALLLSVPSGMAFAEGQVIANNLEYLGEQSGGSDEALLIEEPIAKALGNEIVSSDPNYQFDAATGTITKYIGSETEVTIPSSIEGADVKVVGKNAFAKNTAITKVILNDGLETVGEGAFSGATNLTEIVFPSSLKRIEKGAFIKIGAKDITLNEGLEYLGQMSFSNCTNLESINLPDSLVEIDSRAFLGSKKLASVMTFGGNANHIAYEVFKTTAVSEIRIGEGSQKLVLQKNLFPEAQTKLDIPQNREILISAEAFSQGVEVVFDVGEIAINDRMTKEQIVTQIREKVKLAAGGMCIDKSVPVDHTKDIYIPSEIVWNVENLDLTQDRVLVKGAFAEIEAEKFEGQQCSKPVPTNEGLNRYKPQVVLVVTHILEEEADYEFESTTGTITKYKGNATELTIPTTIGGVPVKEIGKNAFARKTELTKLVLNEGLEIIGEGAFSGCTKLADIKFPSSLKRIEKGAFIKIEAKNITLNEGLEYLGQQSFANSANLETINFPSSLKEIGNLVFANTKKIPGKLSGEFVFGENLGHIGHGVFNYNGTGATFKIADSGSKLFLHDELFPEEVTSLSIPQNRMVMVFARAFNSKEEIILDAGEVEISKGMSKEDIKNLLDSKVLLTSGAAAIKKNSTSREDDIYIETKIEWKLDDLNFNLGEVIVQGRFKELDFGTDESAYEGYTKPDKTATDTAIAKLVPTVKLVLDQVEIEFTQEDFTYDTIQSKHISVDFFFAVTGLSERGKKKLEKTKDLTLPTRVTVEEKGKTVEKKITGIGPKAFENMGIESLKLPDMEGYKEFVIDTAAFAGNDIKNLTLPEGVKVIESFAFKGNKIESLNLPSTLLKVGNEGFKDNKISELNISDDVELIQFDNWSFAGNKIKTVNMPYSVFKTLEFVFADNSGADDEAGVVHLFTRNKAHLSTVTYIKNGQGQRFILIGEDASTERESLYKLFKIIAQLNENDFEPEAWNALAVSKAKAKAVFGDNNSSKKVLSDALIELSGLYDEMVSTGVNKKALAEKVNTFNAFNEEIYTEESFAKLVGEIEKSKQILMDRDATQSEVDSQLADLQKAFDNLVLKDAYEWKTEDFVYDGAVVKGYSDSGKEKFKNNKNLVIPDKSLNGTVITEIGDKAFAMDIKDVILLTDFVKSPNGLKSVKMPITITKIGNEAFIYNAIEDIALHEGITEIGNRAFHSNVLNSIAFPESLTKLGVASFGMNKLKSVKLNHTMTEIPDGTFTMNITLTKIEFPSNIKKIGKSAFVGARFTSIDLTGIEVIEDRAFQANQIEKLVIPSTVKVVSKNAFEQNKKWRRLRELIISEGIESIEANAFKSGLLTEVKLPESLKSLDKNAFIDNMREDKTVSVVKLITTNPEHQKFAASDSYVIELVKKEKPVEPEKPEQPGEGSSSSGVRPNSASGGAVSKDTTKDNKITPIEIRNDYREVKFDDLSTVTNAEEKEAITELAQRGILNGMGNNKFEAGKGLTRAVMLTMLFRIDKTENVTNTNVANLKDIKGNQWHTQVINWGASNQIAQGYQDGTFKASNVLTLSEITTFIVNYLKYKKIELLKINNYTEKDIVNAPVWAKEQILMLLNAGILSVDKQKKLDYNAKLTRGETAIIVNRLLKAIADAQKVAK